MKEYVVSQEVTEWRLFKIKANSLEEAEEMYLNEEGYDVDDWEVANVEWGVYTVKEAKEN